jgi:hypothetical protein
MMNVDEKAPSGMRLQQDSRRLLPSQIATVTSRVLLIALIFGPCLKFSAQDSLMPKTRSPER